MPRDWPTDKCERCGLEISKRALAPVTLNIRGDVNITPNIRRQVICCRACRKELDEIITPLLTSSHVPGRNDG